MRRAGVYTDPDKAMRLTEIIVLGTSQTVAPASVREIVAMGTEDQSRLLEVLASHRDVFSEAAVVGTCTRTEIYIATQHARGAERRLRRLAAAAGGLSIELQRTHTYSRYGRGAARHLMRVASGLDSLMVGEGQVLAQVKIARDVGRSAGTVGPILDCLFDEAIRAGKRVRSETRISRGSVSVAAAAVEHAAESLGGLRDMNILVLGAGATAELVVKHLASRLPGCVTVLNRTLEKALLLAEKCGGEFGSVSDLAEGLRRADAVFLATGAAEPSLTVSVARAATAGREGQPLHVFDLSNPRAAERGVGRVEGLELHDIDALHVVAERNVRRRRDEVPAAERIVEEGLDRFWSWFESRRVIPVVTALRDAFFEVGAHEVKRQAYQFGQDNHVQLERFTTSLINKLLHLPTKHIKNLDPETPADRAKLEALQECFGLRVEFDRETRRPGNDRREALAS